MTDALTAGHFQDSVFLTCSFIHETVFKMHEIGVPIGVPVLQNDWSIVVSGIPSSKENIL